MQLSRATWLLLLKAIFFLSGFTGLVYEVLWTRELANVVGATSVAMTCTFSVFIVCLSIGALIATRIRWYGRPALVLYGLLELAIGVSGFLLTLLLLHRDAWLATWIPATSGAGDLLLQMLATLVLIGLPTTLMGATLPMIMNGVSRMALPSEQVAVIYGLNVIGGACGALACGFLLIWKLGITGTAALILLADAVIAGISIGLAYAIGPDAGAPESRPAAPGPSPGIGWVYPTLAGLTGLVTLAYELLWGRMAKLYLGDRTMATSALLFIYLFCMALGSFAVRRFFSGVRHPSLGQSLPRFGNMLAAGAAAHLLAVAAIYWVMDNPGMVELMAGRALPRVGATLLITLLPVSVLGMAFPYLLQTSRRIDEMPSFAVGALYFVNALAGALGAIFGGYVAPRTVGTLNGFLIVSGFTAVAAALCHLGSSSSVRLRILRAGFAVALLFAASAVLPDNLLFHGEDEVLIAANEDEYGIQIVSRDRAGNIKVKNNRLYLAYKLGPLVTNYAQETMAYFSCLLSERCEDVLNIGTGYGITAGAFTNFDDVTSVRTIEVLPFVCQRQDLFGRFNFRYYEDPRVERICADGRRAVATEDHKYDVISVNVMDPYVPGASGLFTTDFWELAKSRLKPGGVYSQLVWGPDQRLLVQGLTSVFPRVLMFQVYGDSYNAIGFRDDREARLALERLDPRLRRAMEKFDLGQPGPYFSHALDRALQLEAQRLAEGPPDPGVVLHTDDRPVLEYRWAQGERGISMFDSLHAKYDLFN